MKLQILGTAVLGAAAVLVFATGDAVAQTQTAQSAMVSVTLDSGAYEIEGTLTWTFNRGTHHEPGTAMAAYTNTMTSGPTVSCSGNATNCAASNQPAAPAAPAPDDIPLQQHAQAERCTFFFGGNLTSPVLPYKQSTTVNGLNGKGNWKFEWTYTIAPISVAVPAYTAWTSEETNGTVDVGFAGFVASESFMKQSTRNKYSFTMVDGGVTRARSVNATLKLDSTPVATLDLNNVDTDLDMVNDALAVGGAAADFSYLGNAGVFGNAAVFGALHDGTPGRKPANGVVNILNGIGDTASYVDNFAGNNNDLAAGAVHIGPFADSFNGLTDDGTYTITISGVLKGNSGAADTGFSVTSVQTVIGGCTP